ncbi:AAA domain-containing protein [Nannocystis pusilla]|uniref:AAA domain-containing protein n=1 Tax=Nannocystis pusilla TaxID=889268 RepID=UPI003BF2C381
MSRADLLAFLRDPAGFAAGVPPAEQSVWRRGLEIAVESIAAAKDEHGLRSAQIEAWTKIGGERLALVLGPPGTGKTFALSWMALGYLEARREAGQPCRIFLTGFTRNSIANLLSAVVKKAQKYARRPLEFAWLDHVPDQELPETVEQLPAKDISRLLQHECVVVGATNWALHKAITTGKPGGQEGPTAPLFDLVCIDEASQMVVSQGLMSLAGLAPTGRVLVAGDYRQLPPVRDIHEREIDGRMLGTSLYTFLSKAGVAEHPLDETFRLNKPLAEYPARVFYANNYRSVVDAEHQRLRLREGWRDDLEPWEQLVLDPATPICVLLHDGPPCGTVNEFEVRIVADLVEKLRARILPRDDANELTNAAFWADHLAVISPHRAQNAAIRASLKRTGLGADSIVETVDRIQGQERDVIVASYTVSDPEFAQIEAEFIFSPERFNVTITRARHKLILIVSRRLIDVVPDDETLFERARILREYVYDSKQIHSFRLSVPRGPAVQVSLRIRGFEEDGELSVPELAAEGPQTPDLSTLSPELRELLDAIRRIAATNEFRTAASFALTKLLSRDDVFPDLRELFVRGFIQLWFRTTTQGGFWAAGLRDPAKRPWPCEESEVRRTLQRALNAHRQGSFAPYYENFKQSYVWLDDAGRDVLQPIVDKLVAEGLLVPDKHKNKNTIDIASASNNTDEYDPPAELPPVPEDEDFALLNRLEDIEQRRINFGIVETWVTVQELADTTSLSSHELAPRLARLQEDGWLMRQGHRLRSRAAELARELRYLKQRFRARDADERPFLVRSVKVLFQDRDKPNRDVPLSRAFNRLRQILGKHRNAHSGLDGMAQMLASRWGAADPLIAGFQSRAFEQLLPAWFGVGDERSFVIVADTGSGKTEAACLPLITAAAIDAMNGVRGARAILIYPRVRLVNNQAQRLASYLAALARLPGMTGLTLGVQSGEVPSRFPPPQDLEGSWPKRSSTTYGFPLFSCPESDCGGELVMHVEQGKHTHPLECTRCSWRFDGWVGTKVSLRRVPPSLFLLVTESLHSWLQSQWDGAPFGDGKFPAPRAILADEIHLYSHIHGAQVGYALRRLLARLELNSGVPPLAIGMSATLGEPDRVWSQLSGRASAMLLRPDPASECKKNPRAREYFYFSQPEVESRGKDIAGASTTIQALMCLAHGMRRRTNRRGGFRAIAFLDSIDKVKRLHTDYRDAEENGQLARLRTADFGKERPGCCGHPDTCAAFADGECWFFAATDPHQVQASGRYRAGHHLSVVSNPIFSGSRDRAAEAIQGADVVFSTSSLEVGFDDPDMNLVYQHYAPLNAASFVQRKGRGGRGADDRPVTGVTLSVYSPRDTWYFRRPERMLQAATFPVPLNMSNFFVRRGQLICTLMDAAARSRHYRQHEDTDLSEDVFRLAERLARHAFGETVFRDLGIPSMRALWQQVRGYVKDSPKFGFGDWSEAIPEAPTRLFETINLPSVTVAYVNDSDARSVKDEDVGLALFTCAPGTVTRRYGFQIAHWCPCVAGPAPWAAVRTEDEPEWFEPVPGGPTALQDELPVELRQILAGDVYPHVLRPKTLRLAKIGRFTGATWRSAVDWSEGRAVPVGSGQENLGVNPKSEGQLRGFVICHAEHDRGTSIKVPALAPLAQDLQMFQGAGREATGLRVSRIFWGAETRLLLDRPRGPREEVVVTQTFTHPDDDRKPPAQRRLLLHGYQVDTEGIRIRLDSNRLDAFVARELEGLAEHPAEERWLRGQFFRYLVLARAPGSGLNMFQAREAADLLVTARAFEDSREQLSRILKRWDGRRFRDLALRCFAETLSQHPLLTQQRVERLADAVIACGPTFPTILRSATEDCADDIRFRAYLRSLALHGFAVRLTQSFVVHGAGDPRRVLFHVRLPIQFGARSEDVITVFEDGAHGDGTTRTFVEARMAAFAELTDGGLAACDNAREDGVLDTILAAPEIAEKWSRLDATSERTLHTIAHDLGLDPREDSGPLRSIIRVIFQREAIGGESFGHLELQGEVRTVRLALTEQMQREPSAWELVGRVVALATSGDSRVRRWTALLRYYERLDNVPNEESLSPQARLADQVFRLSARLCGDGCPACLHTGTPLFPPQMMDCTVSRRVLLRLERFMWGRAAT